MRKTLNVTGTEPGRRRGRSDHRCRWRGKGQRTVALRVGDTVVLRPVQHAHPVHVLRRARVQHRVLGHQPVRAGYPEGRAGPGHPVLRADHGHQPHGDADHDGITNARSPGTGRHRQRGGGFEIVRGVHQRRGDRRHRVRRHCG